MRCLEAIARQQVEEDVEVVVVDSGSSDGSVERARRLGARVHEILPQEFSHGGARNLGAELAAGDVVVFTSQDAYAADENWLAALVAPLRERGDVAGVYGRQLPHASAIPSERYFLDFLYGPKPRTQRLTGPDRLSFEATLFSNVNSAVPRAVLERYPLAADVIMSEDQEWSRRVLEAGLVIVYEPRAAVRHSHAYTIAGAFRRFFDSGVSADRAYVNESPPPGSRYVRPVLGMHRARSSGYGGPGAAVGCRTRRSTSPRSSPGSSSVSDTTAFRLQVKRRLSGLQAHWDEEGGPATRSADGDPGSASSTTMSSRRPSAAPSAGCAISLYTSPRAGHDVTYVTMRHWDESERPNLAGVRVTGSRRGTRLPQRASHAHAAAPLRARRRAPSLAPRLGVRHRPHGVVSVLPVLAAARSGAGGATSSSSTGSRSGRRPTGGATRERRRDDRLAGAAACVLMPHTAYCFSRLHAQRLVEAGYSGKPVLLPGLYAGPSSRHRQGRRSGSRRLRRAPRAEKRIDPLVRGFAQARERRPALRLELYGDGPERPHSRARGKLGLDSRSSSTGAVPRRRSRRARARRLPRDRVRARGLRLRRRRSRGPRHAERRRRGAGERRDRARPGRRERRRLPGRVAREPCGDAIRGSSTAVRRFGRPPRAGSRKTPTCASTARSSSSTGTPTPRSSPRAGSSTMTSASFPEPLWSFRGPPRRPGLHCGSTTT